MALRDFVGVARVTLNGSTLIDQSSFKGRLESNDTQVFTFLEGFAGFCDGANVVTGTLSLAIPKAGRRQDFFDGIANKETFELVVEYAGKDRIFEGRLTTLDFEYAINTPASDSFEFVGKLVGSAVV